MRILIFAFLVGLGGCTKPNPNRCCTGTTDCTSNNIPVGSTCEQGLVCRGNQCIAETCNLTANCDPAAPYCTNGLCEPTCTDDTQCPGFGQGATDRSCMAGSCVECLASKDCPAERPVCDRNACRTCKLDSECASGACGDSGACLDETSLIYIDAANGLDAGPCIRSAPCKSLQFAVSSTLPMRSHIVMASGTYVGIVNIDSTTTTSPTVTVHGGGGILTPPSVDVTSLRVGNVAAVLHDLTFDGGTGPALQTGPAPCTVYRAKFKNTGGIAVGANLIMQDVEIVNAASTGIYLDGSSHLMLDRVSVHGGTYGLRTGTSGATVDVVNLLVFDTQRAAIDLTGAVGIVESATVADCDATVFSPQAFVCSSGLTVQSSIIWTPGAPSIAGGCTINTSIAGPTSVAGAMSVDPLFVDETHRDYHLSASSPAKDLVDTGPSTDLDGNPRPQGVRFDIGAYEAPP